MASNAHISASQRQTTLTLTCRAVQPWLRADVVREPPVRASSREINDKVKSCRTRARSVSVSTTTRRKIRRTLIKWCGRAAPICGRPRVLYDDILARGHVHGDARELAHVPKVGICTLGGYGADVDHGLESVVGIEAHPRVGPFHCIDVEGRGIGGAFRGDPAVYAVH